MKVVVIGGSGLIGSKLVSALRPEGHEVIAASRSSGVDLLTGEGLEQALRGARVVVDVTNSPSFEGPAALEFFQTAGRNLLSAERGARVAHHVALSVVGTDHLLASGYFRAKLAQEDLVKASGIPYTILRSTQFFEFASDIAEAAADGSRIRLSPLPLQPVAAADVAAILAGLAVKAPLNGTIELAGPELIPLDEFVRRLLGTRHDPREVITDVHAPYFGAELQDHDLTPGPNPRLGTIAFSDWLVRSVAAE